MDSQAPCGIVHYCLRFVVVELTGRLQADHYEEQQVCCPKNGIPQACSLGILSVFTKQFCFEFDSQVCAIQVSQEWAFKWVLLECVVLPLRSSQRVSKKERKNKKKPSLKLIPPQRVDMSHITRTQP